MGMKRQKRRKARIKKFKSRVKASKQKKSEGGGGDGGGGKKKSPTNRRNNNNTGQQKQVKTITRNMSMRQKAKIRHENFKATGVQTHGGTKKNYSRAEARKIEKAFGPGSFSKVTGLSESRNPLGDRSTKFETPAQYEQSLNPDSFKGLSDGVTSGVGPVASGDAYARGLNTDNRNVENRLRQARNILSSATGGVIPKVRKLSDKEISDRRQRMQAQRARMIANRRRRSRGTTRAQQQFEGFGSLLGTAIGGALPVTPGTIDTSNMPSGNSNFELPPGLQDNIPVTNDSTRAALDPNFDPTKFADKILDAPPGLYYDRNGNLRSEGKPSEAIILQNRLEQLGIGGIPPSQQGQGLGFSGLVSGLAKGVGAFGSNMNTVKPKVGDDRGQKRLNLFIDGRRSQSGNMLSRSGRRIRGITQRLTNLNI